ncbi:MAG TPA: vitamin K epoxide reductase family protein [Kofleriaceae bacterium]|nr:vitamin K epoxide reductase family protein [Kofleriaceae bacterium]
MGFAIVGLAASIASAIDYFGADPAFCSEAGCATVRESTWAHPLGIPMPLVGIAFYLLALGLCFAPAPRLRRGLAVAGGAWAVFLIVVQGSVIGAWCKLCLVADPAALGYAVAVLAGAHVLRPTLARGLVVAPSVLATLGALALWTHHAAPEPLLPPGTPAFVEQAQVPGAATVVEVVDFECPHCRRMQERLAAAIAQARFPVRVLRKMLPLPSHPHAMPAALAYCCADAQGKGEEMAAALFATPPEDLTPEGCEKLAARIGCDLERYRSELPRAQARVAAETEEARAAGVHALPTLYVGGEQVVGASKSTADLYALLERAVAPR